MATTDAPVRTAPWRPAWARLAALGALLPALPVAFYGGQFIFYEFSGAFTSCLLGVGLLFGIPLVAAALAAVIPVVTFLRRGGKMPFVLGVVGSAVCLLVFVQMLGGRVLF